MRNRPQRRPGVLRFSQSRHSCLGAKARILVESLSGSLRTETFYFKTDNQYKPVSDTIDSPYDFLIAYEPGRKDHNPRDFA
jgi:hypothetical protein